MADNLDLLFKTARFNLSQVGDRFINDCCFGEDFAAWLVEKLTSAGWVADEAYQEDWGWQVEVQRGTERYRLGAGGASEEDPARPNFGEWRLIIVPVLSIKDRLLRRTREDTLTPELERLLTAEADFECVH
jgi:hypothetical protein